jgi:hypothetical protein
MESHLKDMPDWHAIIPKGVSECKKFMDPHIDEIQKAMSFTKEQCNMKYFIITHCLDLFAFAVIYFQLSLIDYKVKMFSFFSIAHQTCIRTLHHVLKVKIS